MSASATDASAAAAAPPAPPRNRLGLTNLQTRTITICIVGPTVVAFGAYSESCATLLVFFVTFMCGIEWSGVKRHLKVALLMSMESSGAAVAPPPPPSPFIDGVPLCPDEYALPVAPISLYNTVKHLGWALLTFAAYSGEVAFVTMFEFYFLVFVVVTLTAHNRLEVKVEQAMERLGQQLTYGSQNTTPRGTGKDSHAGGAARSATGATGSAKAKPLLSLADPTLSREARLAKAQRNYFLSMELHMFAERQPTEQFLDFCLDIFGILWIAGITTPVFVYHIPNVGVPWIGSTLIGNFVNDIAALVVGRSLKALRERYGRVYDVTGEAGAAGTKRPVSEASALVRLLLRGPHHLYRAISPNKSVEGAVAGVIMNAVSFAGLQYWLYSSVFDAPATDVVAPEYQHVGLWFLLGLIMGVLGVCGDLLQSLLKRAARVKDAGFIIPGHGGMLDRVDGMLLVFPFMYCSLRAITRLSSTAGDQRSLFA